MPRRARLVRSRLTEPLLQLSAFASASVAGNLVAERLSGTVPFWIVLPLFLVATALTTHGSYVLIRRLVLRRFAVDPPAWRSTAMPRDIPVNLRGRQHDLADLGASEPGAVLLLHGMGGVGKTAIAAAVADQWDRSGRTTFWVDCRDTRAIADTMLEVAIALGMPEQDIDRLSTAGAAPAPDAIWRYLDRPHGSGPWLLVFDSADTPAVLGVPVANLTGWLRPSRYGVVIVTSRNRDTKTWGRGVTMRTIDPLSPTDGAQVLRDLAPDATTVDADVRALSQWLGNLPLALQAAGAYLNHPLALHADTATYLNDLRRRRASKVDEGIRDVTGAVLEAWEVTLRALRQAGFSHARRILWLLSILHGPPTAIGLVHLIARSTIPFAGLGRSASQLNTTIRQLHAMNLVTVHRIPTATVHGGHIGEAAIGLHPLVAEIYRAQGLRSLRATRVLRSIFWAITAQTARPPDDRMLSIHDLAGMFVDSVHNLLEARNTRRRARRLLRVFLPSVTDLLERPPRELVTATVEMAVDMANDGDIAAGYYYLAIAQVATASVPLENPTFEEPSGRSAYRSDEPPSPLATGFAWPAIWLAADRRYDQAIRYCDLVDEHRHRWGLTENQARKVSRVRLDIMGSHEGASPPWGDYVAICAAEDDPASDSSTAYTSIRDLLDDLRYTTYLAQLFSRALQWDSTPATIKRRILANGSHRRGYSPLYWRRRLRRIPAAALTDLAADVLEAQNLVRRRARRGHARSALRILTRADVPPPGLIELGALLQVQYRFLAHYRDQVNPPLSTDDVTRLASQDARWAITQKVIQEIDDSRAWTGIRRSGVDWIALLDGYYWNQFQVDAIKFMASLSTEEPPYPVSLTTLFAIGRRTAQDRRMFELQIQALRTWRNEPPTAPPNPDAAARATALRLVNHFRLDDPYDQAARYILAVVNHDRVWAAQQDVDGVAWLAILSTADKADDITESRRILLAVGASLYQSEHTVSLNAAVRQLSQADFEAAIHAIHILRGERDEWESRGYAR